MPASETAALGTPGRRWTLAASTLVPVNKNSLAAAALNWAEKGEKIGGAGAGTRNFYRRQKDASHLYTPLVE